MISHVLLSVGSSTRKVKMAMRLHGYDLTLLLIHLPVPQRYLPTDIDTTRMANYLLKQLSSRAHASIMDI